MPKIISSYHQSTVYLDIEGLFISAIIGENSRATIHLNKKQATEIADKLNQTIQDMDNEN